MATHQQHTESRNRGILHARVGEEIKQKIEELAEADQRDVTNWIKVFVEQEHAKLRKSRRPE